MPSSSLRWVDRSQPQTLMSATILMYINAVFAVLAISPIWLVIAGMNVAAGLGIANEKKWAYWLGVAVPPLTVIWIIYSFHAVSIITLLFSIALVALLLHPQSRSYRKVWFR